jgi:nucleotide-binding universal stress UspA family protein
MRGGKTMTPLNISRILLATDFSAASELALKYAVTLAERCGASLHLLHVMEEPLVSGTWDPQIDSKRVHLENLLSREERIRCSVTGEVRVGRAAATICDVAAERGSDVIVIGTHGRTGLPQVLVGSVAETVLRKAPCPVFAVRVKPDSNAILHALSTLEAVSN